MAVIWLTHAMGSSTLAITPSLHRWTIPYLNVSLKLKQHFGYEVSLVQHHHQLLNRLCLALFLATQRKQDYTFRKNITQTFACKMVVVHFDQSKLFHGSFSQKRRKFFIDDDVFVPEKWFRLWILNVEHGCSQKIDNIDISCLQLLKLHSLCQTFQ